WVRVPPPEPLLNSNRRSNDAAEPRLIARLIPKFLPTSTLHDRTWSDHASVTRAARPHFSDKSDVTSICITSGDREGRAGTCGDAAGKAVNRKVHGSNPCSGAISELESAPKRYSFA